MEAHHHHAISDDAWTQEGARPADYIKLLSKEDTRDLFLEGSYYSFPQNWASQTQVAPPQPPNPLIGPDNSLCYNSYLAFLKSIDYSKSFAYEVHKVIDATGRDQGNNFDPRHFHSNPNVPNANWLWFQAYASIIHGARGIWFWSHPWTFTPSETEKWDAWHTSNPTGNPYGRPGFPTMYNNYVGPLAQELRYLSNNGFLDTESQILSNGDQGDIHGIISEYNFVFNTISESGSIYTYVSDFPPYWISNYRPLNQFGVKYSFQSNGNDIVLIVANPVNSAVQVSFDLSCIGDRRISESNSFEILFSNQVGASATWNTYKINRRNSVDLATNTVLRTRTIGLDNLGELTLTLGPLDVIVLKLNKTSQEISHQNGWKREWTNLLSGAMGGWGLQPWDKFFPGDFDGDGIDEVLAVGSAGQPTDWYTLLKYEDGQWSWLWSNYGNGGILRPYNANFVVGDFDGDGKDELLGNDTWTTLFKWNGNGWDWVWSDNGSTGHPIHPFKDRLYAGDFDGNGTDELLGCDLPSGWTTIFQYSGNNWIWGYWSDMGMTNIIKPYRSKIVVGDFNGDGKDDLLGLNTWATLFNFNNGNWNWLWSTQGSNSFNGWNYPLDPVYDKIIVGNFDSDGKDELMFISTGPYASWALCQDFNPVQPGWNFNWVANDTYSIPFIDDWPINDGTGYLTNYLSIRINRMASDRLLALRKFPCGENGRYLASLYKPIGTQKNLINNTTTNEVIDSVETHSGSDVLIYPNPIVNSNNVTILSKNDFIDGYEIMDMMGHVVSSLNLPHPLQEATATGLEGLSSGIYSIRIRFSNGRISSYKLIYGI